MATTMTAAAMATMATVEAATTTRAFSLAASEPKLRRERNGPRSGQRRWEAGEHDEVGVERDPLQTANAERHQRKIMLQAAELPLHGRASPVEVAPPPSIRAE